MAQRSNKFPWGQIIAFRLLIIISSVLFGLLPSVQASDTVREPPVELPVAFDVDVVVAGGSLAGVEAACAAAEKGARVLLIESRPYLGYDLCGSQRLWIDKDETPKTPLAKRLFAEGRIVTPFEVKTALDQALVGANVPFLTGTFACEILVRVDGTPGGLTIVNRSGRQVVRAKVIIDATKDAALTRQSAAQFKPFRPGRVPFEYIVVGGELAVGAGGRKVPGIRYRSPSTKGAANDYPVLQYNLDLDMPSDSLDGLSHALNEARGRVYSEGMVDCSEHLVYYPENRILPAVPVDGPVSDVCELPIGAFEPKGATSLYVLNAYAGVDRDLAKAIMQPACFAVIGRRIGSDAAETARRRSTTGDLAFSRSPTSRGELVVPCVLPSFRFRDCPTLKLAPHDLPVLASYDVVVVGGGTAGAPAGIAAARSGAKTLVIEYLDELGGVGTAGLIGKYWYGNNIGFTAEATDALGTRWNVVRKSEWCRSELTKAGADIWHGAFGCGAVTRENKVSGVVVATSFGRGVVLADVVIDATGNAEIAAAAGAATEFSISKFGDLSVQVAGYPHRNLGDHYNNTAFAMVDDCDVFDRWHLLFSTRRGTEGSPYDMGQLIDTRDRRRIVGDYTLSTMDILTHRRFPDTISHHRSNFDAAAFPDSKMFFIKDMKGPVYPCDMPLRCLLPRGLEGLLTVGLSASTERDAMTLTRMQADVQNQGYAAGVAAAMAASQTRGIVRSIDIKQLQSELVAVGCLQKRVLTEEDSFPIGSADLAAAVEKLRELTIAVHQNRAYDDTFPALATVMSHPSESIPLLKEAYGKAADKETKITFARILAVLGDSTGQDTLLAAVEAADGWGGGYGLTWHRETHNTFGEVDRLVIALGFLRAPEAIPTLLDKLALLDGTSDLSHYKAICLALRMNKDRSLTLPLARTLAKPGVRGHAQPLAYYSATGDVLKTPERAKTTRQADNRLNSKFKELLVAALLFECGDHNGEGREVLEAYTKDVNGHFAAYADFVLHGAENEAAQKNHETR